MSASGSFSPCVEGSFASDTFDLIDLIEVLDGILWIDGLPRIWLNDAFDWNDSEKGSSLFIIVSSGFAVTTEVSSVSRTSTLSSKKSV